jgi:peptidoglycan/xylan/chitin deacetylase (PgdA/CDA1 family)
VPFACWWERRFSRRLVILNYHRALGDNLRRQLLYLRRQYRIMTLEQAVSELYTSPRKSRHVRDPRLPLALTFDDGYRDNYTYGYALARQLRVPLTIFLIPGYIESGKRFWWLEGARLVAQAHVEQVALDGRLYSLRCEDDRTALARSVDGRLRHAASVAEREVFLERARRALAVPSRVTGDEALALPLSWPEVRAMEAHGWVSYGGHTMHHPVLSYLRDPAEVEREVCDCQKLLEERLGHPVCTFAYPIGRPEHMDERALRAVRAAYDCAVTTIEGVNTPRTDPFLLRRFGVDLNEHWLVLAALVAGVWNPLARIRRALITAWHALPPS